MQSRARGGFAASVTTYVAHSHGAPPHPAIIAGHSFTSMTQEPSPSRLHSSHSMNRKRSLLGAAHALQAGISLGGIATLPFLMLRACPDAPIVQPLRWFIHLSGSELPLTWALASLTLWLLLLSRLYNFKGIWNFIKQGHLKDYQPPPVPDTQAARIAASCLRLE
jgi:hypothetical protein